MTINENSEGVLNRRKTHVSSSTNFEASMKAVENETINGALATQFQEWDKMKLLVLIRFRQRKNRAYGPCIENIVS